MKSPILRARGPSKTNPGDPAEHTVSTAEASLDILCQKSLAGDARAEAALFDALRVRFLPIAKRRVHADQAEDLVQDALKIVFDRYGSRNEGQGILVWGMTVLRNVIGNHYQSRDRERERLSFVDELPHDAADENDPFGDLQLADTRRQLLDAIDSLAVRYPRCGRIFHHLLSSLERGGGPQEVSTRTLELVRKEDPGMNRGRFYTALHRCRAQLRDVLGQMDKGMCHD